MRVKDQGLGKVGVRMGVRVRARVRQDGKTEVSLSSSSVSEVPLQGFRSDDWVVRSPPPNFMKRTTQSFCNKFYLFVTNYLLLLLSCILGEI